MVLALVACAAVAAANSRCAGVACPPSVFVHNGEVDPAACAVTWAADYVPLPKAQWKGCCFDAKVDCAKAALRAVGGQNSKLLPAYGDAWLPGFAGTKLPSSSACQRACDTTPGCAGGTFVGRDGLCWLVPRVGSLRDPCGPADLCAAFTKTAGEDAEAARRATLAALARVPATTRVPTTRSAPATAIPTAAQPLAAVPTAAPAVAVATQELRILVGLPGVSAEMFRSAGADRLTVAIASLCGAARNAVEVQGDPTVGAKGIGVRVAVVSTSASPTFLNGVLSKITDPDFAAALSRHLAKGMGGAANPFRHGSGFSTAVIKDTTIESTTPRPCELTAWSSWSACSATCGGGGVQRRARSMRRAGSYGAAPCAALESSRPCRASTAAQAKVLAAPCPVPCELTKPTECTPCSKRCGGGEQECLVSVVAGPMHGGAPCPEPRLSAYFISMGEKARGKVNVQQRCGTQSCPVDCAVSFSAWSPCSVSCGSLGMQHRQRTVVRLAAFGGKPCVAEAVSRGCNAGKLCPGPCVLASWGVWGQCTKTCGDDGVRSRTRRVVRPAAGGGTPCAATLQQKICEHIPECHVDCKMSAPVCTKECSKTCGAGAVHRSCTRTILQKPWGGKPCGDLELINVVPCKLEPCAVDCAVSAWSLWLPCSQTCRSGGPRAGTRTRIRRIVGWGASHGGKACPPLVQRQACGATRCADDAVCSSWACGACSKTCGSGTASCTRFVLSPSRFGGRTCTTKQHKSCEEKPCAHDCAVSAWSTWSGCSKTCGLGGSQQRSRSVTQPPQAGGAACPPTTGARYCAWQGQCPVDCATSAWSTWTSCSLTCGGGSRTRHRWVRSQAAFGGRRCPALDDRSACNTAPCAVDCQVGPWTGCLVSQCSRKCGGGTMQCQRAVTTQMAAGGRICPALKNKVACNQKNCGVDCAVSAWSSWSVCSKSCGGGSRTRSRKVNSPARYAGEACPSLGETTKCGTAVCPADCVTSGWQAWSVCSVTCGLGGQRKRTRRIAREIEHGGARCPALAETAACRAEAPCPFTPALVMQLRAKYCAVHAWSSWSQCTRSCAGGVSGRMRERVLPFPLAVLQSLERKDSELHRMVGCPGLREQHECNNFKCTLGARCNAEQVRCEVKMDAQHRMHLHIKHNKPASWKMPSHLANLGNFKCSRVRTQQPATLAVTPENVRRLSAAPPAPVCRCECSKHSGCQSRAEFALKNAVLPGNALKAASADLCCEKCTNHPHCGCWTFHAGKRLCELKLGAPLWLALSGTEGAEATASGVRAH